MQTFSPRSSFSALSRSVVINFTPVSKRLKETDVRFSVILAKSKPPIHVFVPDLGMLFCGEPDLGLGHWPGEVVLRPSSSSLSRHSEMRSFEVLHVGRGKGDIESGAGSSLLSCQRYSRRSRSGAGRHYPLPEFKRVGNLHYVSLDIKSSCLEALSFWAHGKEGCPCPC